jgi:hypothetical protein
MINDLHLRESNRKGRYVVRGKYYASERGREISPKNGKMLQSALENVNIHVCII